MASLARQGDDGSERGGGEHHQDLGGSYYIEALTAQAQRLWHTSNVFTKIGRASCRERV